MNDLASANQLVEQEFNWDETPPSVATAYVLASVENMNVEDLPPLYEHVEGDALNTLVTDGEGVSVSFSLRGYVVEITGDRVTIYSAGTVGP